MAEYGNGHTIGSAAELDKERIIHALRGELVAGEDEQGFIYERAPKDECDRYVLEAFDNMVHQCQELAASGRAMERIIEEHGGIATHFKRYMDYHAEESRKYNDYLYESEKDELQDEIERLEHGD